jgi:hypothetical protein
MDWFKTHVYIAAWASPVVALIGMMLKKRGEDAQLNWSKLMLYVAFLSGLAIIVTPGVDAGARGVAGGLIGVGFGWLMVDASRQKK